MKTFCVVAASLLFIFGFHHTWCVGESHCLAGEMVEMCTTTIRTLQEEFENFRREQMADGERRDREIETLTTDSQTSGTELVKEQKDLYYFMSPTWLTAHAQFFEIPTNETGRLVFGTGTSYNHRLFKVLLASPGSLLNSTTYVVSVKLWFFPLSARGADVFLTICDTDDCYGYLVGDEGGFIPAHSKSSETTCGFSGGVATIWNVPQQLYDFRFELSPSHTLTMLWRGTSLDGGYNTYDAMKPSGGLWLTVCRDEIEESLEVRFIEVSIKAT